MKMHAAHRPGGHRRSATAVRLAAGLSIVGCAVALSACGASGGSGQSAVGATTASGNASPLGLSQWMRAHGVPSFADLTSAPIGVVATKRLDVNASSPAFRHAITLCGDPPGLRVRR
ncbi:MAG TPA: hypothetical protein VIY10_10920 [Solirubrobacteraceae bacterium]|jgi:hypothetical protein